MAANGYFVYMLRCTDDTFYIGITTDLQRRIREHNGSSKGAKYTRGRRPVFLVYFEQLSTQSEALKREFFLKQLNKKKKEHLIQTRVVKCGTKSIY